MLEQSAPSQQAPSQQSVLNIASWLVEAFTSHQAGRLADAERLYKQILAAQPDHSDSLYLLSAISYQRGDYARALGQIELALNINSGNSLLWNQRGLALQRLKRLEEAVASYDRVLALWPDHPEALCNRGAALYELKRFDAALASYDRALAARPHYAEAFCYRGSTLLKLSRSAEALASFDCALAVQPDYADAHTSRGELLMELKRFDEALASYDRALALGQDTVELHYNRGNALRELKRYDEALASFDRALALEPDSAITHSNRGVALFHLRRLDEAAVSLARALSLQPDLAAAHFAEAHYRLLTGDLPRGWEKAEWRWQVEPLKSSNKRDMAQPQWSGLQEIAGKTVLLHSADGFGDAIQFCRYAPLVAARGARVILEVLWPQQELMRTLAGVTQVVAQGEPLPDFDLQCPLLSLPRAFGTALATIPAEVPYLHAAASAVESWNARLGPRCRPRIGIAWSGNPIHHNDHNRSIGLRAFLPLLAGVDAAFVSLQREVRAADAALLRERSDILHFGKELKDYADTAALIANLDLVVSVDTSVAHLAGALAKPVWILLPDMPDWRWLLNRDDNPWYPTARLFRQDETRTWDGVVARAAVALQDYVRGL
ncbi:MAG TPA: tetratricopeptide repeat protein [Xanthobacteraceae bacterium]|nr:tetratricopeptide repeat protein [Xanthobacteraceae bacterium]